MASRLPNETIQEIVLILYEAYSKPFDIIYNSCMLINKNWCVNTMAVMWRKTLDDYSGSESKKTKIIDTYIVGLPQDSKNLLKTIGISESLTCNGTTYYNYASFLREVDLLNLYEILLKYLNFLIYNIYSKTCLPEEEVFRIEILYRELLKHFVRESNNLSYKVIFTEIYPFNPSPFYNNLSEIIPSNSHLISFTCSNFVKPEALVELSKIFSSVDNLKISLGHYKEDDCSRDNAGLVTFIESVDTIKELQFHMEQYNFPKVAGAISKKVVNLVKLSVKGGAAISWNIFKDCEKLKFLRIDYLEDQNENILELFTDHKNLEKFKFNGVLNDSHFDKLVQNANGNIKTLFLHNCYVKEEEKRFFIFNSIYNHCPRLTELYIRVDKETIEYIFIIFEACQNLQKLALFNDESCDIDDWMLRFPALSPPSLQYFKLKYSLRFNLEILNDFFQSCYDHSIKNMYFFVMDSHFSGVKELIEKYIELGTLNWKSRRCYLGFDFFSQYHHFYTVKFTV